jgi:serine/threonine-protein phosphatase 2A regulatory subunit A
MSQALTGDAIRDHMVPLAVTLANDPIPNVKFNVAKTISIMIPLLKKSNLQLVLNDKIKPTLLKLGEDSDVDVRYFSQQALLQV